VLFALLTTLEKAWQHMEKAEISWFLTIWLFLPRLAFFWTWFGFFSQKMSGNPGPAFTNALAFAILDLLLCCMKMVCFFTSSLFNA